MINEILFFCYATGIALSLLAALRSGKETLIAYISVLWVLANFFVTKSITLFGFDATASDTLAIGATLGLNLVQEFFGAQAARATLLSGFFCLGTYTVLSLLHCLYLPSLTDVSHVHFCALLTPMPRIALASLGVFLFSQYCEYRLYGFFKRLFHDRHFLLRNYLSTCISQALDTVLFSFLGLYGILSPISHIIVISYTLKLLTIVLAGSFVALAKKIIRKHV